MTARKVMLLGEMGVGKTSLVRRLVRGEFKENYAATIGVDLYPWHVDNAGPAGDQPFEMVIWDTDGHRGTRIVDDWYTRGAAGALVIADATRPQTLDLMVEYARAFTLKMPGSAVVMIINKADLVSGPDAVAIPAGSEVFDAPLLWTSARTGDNVRSAFASLAGAIMRRGI